MDKEKLQKYISKIDNAIKEENYETNKEDLENILTYLCELRDRRNGIITYTEEV